MHVMVPVQGFLEVQGTQRRPYTGFGRVDYNKLRTAHGPCSSACLRLRTVLAVALLEVLAGALLEVLAVALLEVLAVALFEVLAVALLPAFKNRSLTGFVRLGGNHSHPDRIPRWLVESFQSRHVEVVKRGVAEG